MKYAVNVTMHKCARINNIDTSKMKCTKGTVKCKCKLFSNTFYIRNSFYF